MNPLRVGTIGVGRMGQRHCRVYSSLQRAQLVGVCDANPELGQRIAHQYGCTAYEQVDDLLDHVDAVSLVAPTPAHFDLAMRCVERGVPVLIEKPITETLEQAEALSRAAQARGVIVQVGHIERFNPAYNELRNVLEDMTPLAMTMRRLSPYDSSNTDVDVVLDLMVHDADLALDLVDKLPVSVSAYGLAAFQGTADHAVAQISFGTGPLLTLIASRVTEQKVRVIEVTALEAYLECDLLNKSISVYRHTIGEYLNHNSRGVKYHQESIVERIHVPMVEPLMAELEHFCNCVLEGHCPLVSAEDGVRALRLAMAIRDQIISQNLVDLRPQLVLQRQALEMAVPNA